MQSIETRGNRLIVIRLEEGEPLLESLENIARKYEVKAAVINAIGALKLLHYGIFRPAKKQYEWFERSGFFELVSAIGNISWDGDDPVVHVHISVADQDGHLIGGHCGRNSTITITGEIYVLETDEKVTRETDPTWGIKVLAI